MENLTFGFSPSYPCSDGMKRRHGVSSFQGRRCCLECFVLALSLFLMSACNGKGDEPDPSLGSGEVVVSLQIDTTMVDFKTIEEDSRAAGGYDLRCLVRAYSENASGSLAAVPAAQTTVVFSGGGKYGECSMVLPSGKYRLLAWADWVESGSQKDKFYNTADFADITFLGTYCGNTNYRNAYSGSASVSFSASAGDTTHVQQTLPMRSVMGKVKFIATDYNEYLEAGQNLRILVAYTGFLPNHYSLLRGVPFDATTGVNFISTVTEPSTEGTGTATLGFDYVMVNGEESSVTMALGLYNDEGKLVGQSSTLNVPIKRGGITVVKDKFLTRTAGGGGIGIDPSFEGDINVYY